MESGYGENFPDSLREFCRFIDNRFVLGWALGCCAEFAHARNEFAFDGVFVLFDSSSTLLFASQNFVDIAGFLEIGEKLPLESSWKLLSGVACCQIFFVVAYKR